MQVRINVGPGKTGLAIQSKEKVLSLLLIERLFVQTSFAFFASGPTSIITPGAPAPFPSEEARACARDGEAHGETEERQGGQIGAVAVSV